MNVSLPQPMEKFIRQKVARGDYETASEVVREGLRLLRQRDETWKRQIRNGIEEGYESIRQHGLLTEAQVESEMKAFKKKWRRSAAK